MLVSAFRWIPESPSQNLCLVTVLGGDLWDTERMPSRPRRPVAKEPPAAQVSHAVLGYARVSTGHQVLDQQLDALSAAGVAGRVFTDTMSGTRDDRPGLAELMAYARAGDTVTVVALDRLGRSLSGIVQTVKTLGERGIVLRSLREGVDTSTSTGGWSPERGSSCGWVASSLRCRASVAASAGAACPKPTPMRWSSRRRSWWAMSCRTCSSAAVVHRRGTAVGRAAAAPPGSVRRRGC